MYDYKLSDNEAYTDQIDRAVEEYKNLDIQTAFMLLDRKKGHSIPFKK